VNRRSLFGSIPKIAAVSLITGTALSVEQPDQDPRTSWGPQPHYHILYTFQYAPVNDFVAIGVYTKREDADEHCKRVKAAFPKLAHCTVVVPRSHEEFCYEMANHRLGAMAEHMRKVMGIPIPLNEYGVDMRESAYTALYTKVEFPAIFKRV
jgi:hypothetical protein